MLNHFFHTPLALGLAQAVVVTVMALGVMALARYENLHLERETVVSLVRGLVQIIVVGYVLIMALKGPTAVGFLLVIAMIVAAAFTAARRAKGVPAALRISLWSIAFGSAAVIVPMCLLGVIDMKLVVLVPVGSMIIAGNMTTCAQALERFVSDVGTHTGMIEAALALGADPPATVLPYTQAAFIASLIPRIDSLRSLGIVWIPGLMAGMLLSGAPPVTSALFQFTTLAMMYASSGITVLIALRLIQPSVFSPAGQLIFGTPASTKMKKGGA